MENSVATTYSAAWEPAKHLAFFGLSEEPFQMTPNRDFFYRADGHISTLEVVRYGLAQGDGFIIVCGEVGTGKTLLLRLLMEELQHESFETALILSPLLSPRELLQAILTDLGEIGEGIVIKFSMDSLIRKLNAHLFNLARQNKRLLLVIDEAQDLPTETIEQLRLLSNFESDRRKWMQIILVGQPELKEKINRPQLRQLLQRVTIMEHLKPLSRKEASEYVTHRLGKSGRPDITLPMGAAKTLWKLTAGVPRSINRLMSRALLVAYSRHSQKLTAIIIRQAQQSLASAELPRQKTLRFHPKVALATLSLLLVLAFYISLNNEIKNVLISGLTNLLSAL